MKKGRCKRVLALIVALVLIISSITAVNVMADENTQFEPSITYSGAGHTFGKLSHPDKALSTPDGIVDYLGNGNVGVPGVDEGAVGQGDQGQSYSWASASYGDWMYVGTCYAAMGNTLKYMDSILGDKFDEEVMAAALKAMFNGTFFYGHEKEDGTLDKESGGILVKVNVKTGETKLLMSESTTGKGPLFRNGIRYKDKLYFCGSVRAKGQKNGLPSIYCVDPKTDNIECVYTGITPAEAGAAYQKGISTGIRGMAVFNGEFIASCVGLEGPYILKSSDPSAGQSSFKKIATKSDLFDYPAYHFSDSIYGGSIWEMVEFNGSLYVALCTGTPDNKPDEHTMQSFAIVRGDEQADGSWTWTPVVGDKADGAKYTFGIDPERTRSGACNMLVYNDHLYIGEYEDIEIALEDVIFKKNVEFLAKNLEQSVNLYRMDKDENMELVVGDATEMFPDGGISGLASGFGHHENQYIWQSTVFDGKMYFGTFDSSSLLEPIGQFTNGDLLNMTPEQWKSQINYIKVLVELLLNKYAPAPKPQPIALTDAEDVVSSDEVEAVALADLTPQEMVERAIKSANNRYEEAAASYSDKDAEAAEPVELSKEQTAALVKGLKDGSIEPNSMDEEAAQEAISLLFDMTTLSSEVKDKGSEDFVEVYTELYDAYAEVRGELPDSVKKLLDTLITVTKKDNLVAFAKIMCYLSKAERGFDLYTSADGINFSTVTTNGFGDPYNHGLRAFSTGDDWMVIGTANPFMGTQLWKLTVPNGGSVKPEKPEPEKPGKPDSTNPPASGGDNGNSGNGNGNAGNTGNANGPKTGDAAPIGTLVLILGAASALAVTMNKKRKSSK